MYLVACELLAEWNNILDLWDDWAMYSQDEDPKDSKYIIRMQMHHRIECIQYFGW